MRIARNNFLDWAKKKRIPCLSEIHDSDDPDYNPHPEIPDPAPLPEALISNEGLRLALSNCIGHLPNEHKKLIDMFQKDKPQREIAKALQLALGTVNKRLKAVFKILEGCLKKSGWSQGSLVIFMRIHK